MSDSITARSGEASENEDVGATMSEDVGARRLYDYVRVSVRQGRSANHIIESTTRVFTADWPLRRRLRLAWKLIRR